MIPPCNHPGRDVDPDARNKYWEDFVKDLELTHVNDYDPYYERRGAYNSSPEVFIAFYRTLISGLGGLFSEQCYPGADKNTTANRHPLTRALDLLNLAYVHLGQNRTRADLRAEIVQLRRLLREIGCAPWNGLDRRIGKHVDNMHELLTEMAPTAQECWDGEDLRDDRGEFQKIFEDFQEFGKKELIDEGSCYSLIQGSQSRVVLAIEALALPSILASVPDDLLEDDVNPTYLHHPCTAPEFLYGQNGHRGMLHVKEQHGGPLTADDRNRMNAAAKRRGRDDNGEATKHAKKRRTNLAYDLTLENVEAELLAMKCDAKIEEEANRPAPELLVTPTNPYKAEVLEKYSGDFWTAIKSYDVFDLPSDRRLYPAQRAHVLEQLSEAIDVQRKAARDRDAQANPIAVKRARVAAFTAKYLRALYTKIVLAQEHPPPSDADLRRALAARLEDWRLHEEIWNTGDAQALGRRHKTATEEARRARRRQLQHDIRRRTKNAIKWEGMEEALRTDGAAVQEEGAAGAPAAAKEEEKPRSPGPDTERPENAWIIDLIMGKRRRGREVFWNHRLERDRERWYRACIDARGKCLPVPPRPVLRDTGPEPYALEGPPGHEQLPLNSVWDKLQYMIVLTHWRIYQGRLIPR